VTDLVGAGRYASNDLSIAGTQIAWNNHGLSGNRTDSYFPNFADSLAFITPGVAVFSPWSPNNLNLYNAAAITEAVSFTDQFVALARVNGFVPMVATPTPVNGLSQGNEDGRVAVVDAIKAEVVLLSTTADPVFLLDRNAIYVDPVASTGGYLAGLSDDGVHPNAVGYQVESDIMIQVINAIRQPAGITNAPVTLQTSGLVTQMATPMVTSMVN